MIRGINRHPLTALKNDVFVRSFYMGKIPYKQKRIVGLTGITIKTN
jgi:hypothetical protein